MSSSRLSFTIIALLGVSSFVLSQPCKLQFDGRVPAALSATDFDAPNDIFSETFVLGQGLIFSQALRLLPAAAGSLVRLTQPLHRWDRFR